MVISPPCPSFRLVSTPARQVAAILKSAQATFAFFGRQFVDQELATSSPAITGER
jgi:hypothetical protein